MSLYQAKSGDWRFKCFSCKEQGDIFDFVQKVENCDFPLALEKVASYVGETLPKRRKKKSASASSGVEVAQRLYAKQSADEKNKLATWAVERSFKSATLADFSISFANSQKLSTMAKDTEEKAALLDAHLIYRPRFESPRQPELEIEVPPRDAMYGERVIFPLRDWSGATLGFIGRAVQSDVKPKYQFTRHFPKSQSLFGFDVAKNSLNAKATIQTDGSKQKNLVLYVVEGATDVLRLHELGFDAVAVMGSDLSKDQAGLIERLSREIADGSVSLTVRLFFDGDEAGFSATRLALAKLLPVQSHDALFGIEVVCPRDKTDSYHGRDPDEWLRTSTKQSAQMQIDSAVVSSGQFLMAYGLRCEIDAVDSRWQASAMTQRYAAMRRIDNLLPKTTWKLIFDVIGDDLFTSSIQLSNHVTEPGSWQTRLIDFLSRTGTSSGRSVGPLPDEVELESTKLVHAMQIANAFSQRREFPVDSRSWDRLLASSNVVTLYLQELLQLGASNCNIEPLLGMHVPKQSGGNRLKAIPCPEQLSIQQYLINELLGASIASLDFVERIPAVRYDGGVLRLTAGPNSDSRTVSCFSYQIDMEIVRGEKPPGNEGIFRPYTDCWSDFVDHLSRKVQAGDEELFDDRPFHVARLDIRSYYDTLTRSSVDRILFEPLQEAIKSLDEPRLFAPSFRPDVKEATQRTREFIDLICDQSFGYTYIDPDTGLGKQHSDGSNVGIPQGPSLSAYIGSISLFKLDQAVQDSIESSQSKAAYARYVDDMVLITRSKSELDKLRGIIQKELGLIGLELSPKVEPLPSMNAVQVQNWLTANRGLANVSGIVQTPPIVGPPLGDDGSIDRRAALIRLHDSELLSPLTSDSTLLDVIQGVLTCPDVRFSDQCYTAELIWRLIAGLITRKQLVSDASNAIADKFASIWNRSLDEPGLPRGQLKWMVLAAVHGLDRFISRRNFKSDLLLEEQQDESYAMRQEIARAVLSGLVERLLGLLPNNESSLKHILAVHELSLIRRALSLTTITNPAQVQDRVNRIASEYPRSTNVTRHVASIATLENGFDAIGTLASMSRGQTDPHILFHEAVTRLSIPQVRGGIDPLIPIVEVVKDAYRQDSTSVLPNVLKSWLPNETTVIEEKLAIRSLSVFLNVVERNSIWLVNRREKLLSQALRYTNGAQATWLPCLPIDRISGFIGYSSDSFLAVPVIGFRPTNNEEQNSEEWDLQPVGDWKPSSSQGAPDYWQASSASHELLPISTTEAIYDEPGLPRWIADSFENLVNLSANERECPPNAFNLLIQPKPDSPKGAKFPITNVLGFSASCQAFDAQAFVRSSDQSLVPRAVYANGARYWRAGIAIADALGLLDEVFYDPLKSIVRPTHASKSKAGASDHQWAMAKLIRFSLHRLCGNTANSNFVRESPSVPKSLQRVLDRLRSFPTSETESAGYQKLATVLAAVFETRFAAARFDDNRDQDWQRKSGAAASVLAQIARRVVYTDKQLAMRLPRVTSNQSGKRRNVSAWLSLAVRVFELQAQISDDVEALRTPLLGFCNGLAITGLGELLRCLTLETIAADQDLREQIASLKPSSVQLADWHLDGFELLTHRHSQTSATDRVTTEVGAVLLNLKRGLANDNRHQGKDLERITPLGWAVLAGVATGFLRSDLKLSFLRSDIIDPKFTQLFKEVCSLLTPSARGDTADNEEADDPWTGLAQLLGNDILGRVLKHVEELECFGEELGLSVSSLQSSTRFRMEPTEFESDSPDTQKRTWRVSLDEAEYEIEPWRIATASTSNEPRNARAENVRSSDGCNIGRTYFWTETRVNQELISLHVAKPGIADLAGFHLHPDQFAETERDSAGGDDPSDLSLENEGISAASIDSKDTDANLQIKSEAANISMQRENPKISGIGWQELVEHQNRSWKSRSKSAAHYKRVAFVQWQVEELGSYRHPIYECREQDLDERSPNGIEQLATTIEAVSYVEHRRRRLLTEVLRACKAFEVEMLLLPEYSTRPETVDWLRRRLQRENISLTVWAGTFRFPPLYPSNRDAWTYPLPEWSSVLPIIESQFSSSSGVTADIKIRLKKYPSIAYGEIFNPERDVLEAKTKSSTHAVELICSEVFLASSPTNLICLGRSWDDLCCKFGTQPRSDRDAIQYVLQDITSFALSTARKSEGRQERRILLVPAMTPRTVDYAVLGQASYLAAGLTTVFCNDSGGHSRGQSCFIGQNGWDRETRETPGLPGPGPYHGVVPGFYRPFEEGRGWLGQEEQAMVIADVDPFYQAEGKPRPQNLMPPLNLIAHLPILEVGRLDAGCSGTYGRTVKLRPPDSHKLAFLQVPDANFWPNQTIANVSSRQYVISTLLTQISKHIAQYNPGPNTIHDARSTDLFGLLSALAFSAPENRDWLEKRATAYSLHHTDNPMPYPPPVALDWLYVDITADDPENTKILVPPLRCPMRM